MSIRARLASGVALVLFVALAAFGAALIAVVRAVLIDQVDDRVLATSVPRGPGPPLGPPGASGAPGPPGPRPPAPLPTREFDPSGRQIAEIVYGPGGEALRAEPSGFVDAPDSPPRLPAAPGATGVPMDRIVTLPAEDGSLSYRAIVRRGPRGETVLTAAPLREAAAAIDRIVRALLIAGCLALATAGLAAWWLIGRGLRPIDQMIDTAAAIAGGDLDRRVPASDPATELGRLGLALNEMLGRIQTAMQQRAESEDRLRRFVADAAHELRTPLTSLGGYAELYQQGALPDPAALDGAMARIRAESGRLAGLVDDLLLLARLDQERGLEVEVFDLIGLIDEAVLDFRAGAPDRPVCLDLPDEAYVRGDRARLRQVLDNLLANARIHTPPGTPVRVTARLGAGWVEVGVADEGPGIAPEDQARVFERFWRSDPSRARRTGGSGLGLAIVASLVESHGGSITLTSAPGTGACFTVRLPLAIG